MGDASSLKYWLQLVISGDEAEEDSEISGWIDRAMTHRIKKQEKRKPSKKRGPNFDKSSTLHNIKDCRASKKTHLEGR